MKKAFAILFLSFSVSAALCQAGKEEELWSSVHALNKAIFEAKDSLVLAGLLSDSVTYGHSNGNIENKTEMINTVLINPEIYKNMTVEKLSAGHAGQTMLVRYTLKADAMKDGNTSLLYLSVLQVWGRENGKLKLFARQAVKINLK